MDIDPVRPIRAKVDRLRQWHSFPFRYWYEFCRVIFIIVGSATGLTVTTFVYCAATHTSPAETGVTGGAVTIIGGVIGLASGWYLAFLGSRIMWAIVRAAGRAPPPGNPQPINTDIKES